MTTTKTSDTKDEFGRTRNCCVTTKLTTIYQTCISSIFERLSTFPIHFGLKRSLASHLPNLTIINFCSSLFSYLIFSIIFSNQPKKKGVSNYIYNKYCYYHTNCNQRREKSRQTSNANISRCERDRHNFSGVRKVFEDLSKILAAHHLLKWRVWRNDS